MTGGVQMEHNRYYRWILAPSVDTTATIAAAARAVASRQANPIINDPFAEVLVDACGAELFGRLASGDLEFVDIGTDWMVDFFAARARFFDGFFAGACSSGIRQAVIVGSGLDSRSYRLEFPSGTVVYEIDRPDVVAFKTGTLSRLGATPNAELRLVGVELRQDWPKALRRVGFDLAQPTAWLAEWSMVAHLPVDARKLLLERITSLSTRGSRLTADYLPGSKHSDVEQFLRVGGWRTAVRTLEDLLRDAELSVHTMDIGPNAHGAIHYLTATRN
jgi:methyltransferase (TIGR00027 family)